MGKRQLPEEPTSLIGFVAPVTLRVRLERAAKLAGVSMSEVIRQALERQLTDFEPIGKEAASSANTSPNWAQKSGF